MFLCCVFGALAYFTALHFLSEIYLGFHVPMSNLSTVNIVYSVVVWLTAQVFLLRKWAISSSFTAVF